MDLSRFHVITLYLLSPLTFHIQAITGQIFSDGISRKAWNTFLVKSSVNYDNNFLGAPSFLDFLLVESPMILNQVRKGTCWTGEFDRISFVDVLLVSLETNLRSKLHIELCADSSWHLLSFMTRLALQNVPCHVGGNGKCEGWYSHEPRTEMILSTCMKCAFK